MLQNWLVVLPELSLIGYLAVAWMINRYRSTTTPKTYFTVAKYAIGMALLSTVVFYNRSVFPQFWINNAYTTLFKVVIFLLALAWFYLSSKWFLAKNKSSYAYFNLGVIGLLGLELLISSTSLLLPAIIMPLLCVINWRMLHLYTEKDTVRVMSRLYIFFAALFMILLWSGIGLIWYQSGTFSCPEIKLYFASLVEPVGADYASVGLITAALLFMLAIAPFHSWYIGILTFAILPVCGYLSLLPPLAYLSCLINFMLTVFGHGAEFLKTILLIFASFSLFIGALSANGASNIRRLFGFSAVYHLGFLLFGIVSFNEQSILAAFVYMTVCLLALAGVYTVFLGLKSRGDFLTGLEDIEGLSGPKPFLAASMLIFMISLIGIPPMLGFLGRLSVINNLVISENWSSVIILLVSLLFMANAYLQVIRTIYFEPQQRNFDRTDKSIYICLFINLLLVGITILNPSFLLKDAELILKGFF